MLHIPYSSATPNTKHNHGVNANRISEAINLDWNIAGDSKCIRTSASRVKNEIKYNLRAVFYRNSPKFSTHSSLVTAGAVVKCLYSRLKQISAIPRNCSACDTNSLYCGNIPFHTSPIYHRDVIPEYFYPSKKLPVII